MTTDPRFSTYNARTANIGALYQLVGEVAATKTTDEWLVLLNRADIPAARCATLPEVLEDEHLRGTGFIHERQHPAGFPYIAMQHPVKFAGTPADIRREPPLLGEHTVEVLKELGFSDADAERIAAAAKKPEDRKAS